MPALHREAAWAEERLSGDLRQSVPQNGCVHLHIIEIKLPLSKLCAAALCSTEWSTFRGGEQGEEGPGKGVEEEWPAKGAKRKEGRVKTSQQAFSEPDLRLFWNLP